MAFKIAYLGDSHAYGGMGLYQNNWRNRVTAFFSRYKTGVTGTVYATGGETIADNMPASYAPPGTAGKSIDDVLAGNPDLILILHAGNHFANGFTQEAVQTLYTDMISYINAANKPFAISTAGPRSTYFPGSSQAAYITLCKDFNTWLASTYPNDFFDIWQPLTNPATDLPVPELLQGDGLHYVAEGHRRMAEATLKNSKIMGLAGFEQAVDVPCNYWWGAQGKIIPSTRFEMKKEKKYGSYSF